MVLRELLCSPELFPDIAGEVFIRIFIPVCQRIFEDDTSEFFCDLFLCFPCQLRHKRQVNPGFFPDGERQGFHSRIHARDRFRAADGTFGEDISLPVELPFFIQDLEGCQEAVTGILCKSPAVCIAADDAVLGGIFVIAAVQAALDGGDFRITPVLQLGLQQLLNDVAQLDHAEDTLRRCGRKIHAVHAGVLTVVDMAVDIGIAEVFD